MAGTLVLRTARIEELELLVRSLTQDAQLGVGVRIIAESIKNACRGIVAYVGRYLRK